MAAIYIGSRETSCPSVHPPRTPRAAQTRTSATATSGELLRRRDGRGARSALASAKHRMTSYEECARGRIGKAGIGAFFCKLGANADDASTRPPSSRRSTMPCSQREAHATPRTPREPGRGGSFSAAARQHIRHAAALAHELGTIHSTFRAYGVVWTIHRLPPRPEGSRSKHQQQQTTRQPSARQPIMCRWCSRLALGGCCGGWIGPNANIVEAES